jgi:hypothetical protein
MICPTRRGGQQGCGSASFSLKKYGSEKVDSFTVRDLLDRDLVTGVFTQDPDQVAKKFGDVARNGNHITAKCIEGASFRRSIIVWTGRRSRPQVDGS